MGGPCESITARVTGPDGALRVSDIHDSNASAHREPLRAMVS
jgi:hypothetical protein